MIKKVYIMRNGMVAVFNENGKQIAKLQGCIFDIMKKIGKEITKETEIYINDNVKTNMDWWIEKRDEKND